MQKYYEILIRDFNIQPIAFNFDTIRNTTNKFGIDSPKKQKNVLTKKSCTFQGTAFIYDKGY